MAGLVPATHTRWGFRMKSGFTAALHPSKSVSMDGRDKPGHDEPN
jgi:hypothetical protein